MILIGALLTVFSALREATRREGWSSTVLVQPYEAPSEDGVQVVDGLVG